MTKIIPLAALLGFAGLAAAQAPTIGNCTVFPADNIWNTRIDQLPVHPSSATWVSTMGATSPLHPDFGSLLWEGVPNGVPFITVAGTQTLYPATFLYQTESDPGPYAIPLNAPIEGGSASTADRHVISADVDHCILYELYAAYPQAASWSAGSGAIFNLLSNALRPATWTSADAAGLPYFAGLVRHYEIAGGAIRHAIRVMAAQTQAAYVWPARHYASSLTGSQYPPMGVRFRLKASFDISGFSPTNQIILTALKQYGMILADNGASWHISGDPDPGWDDADLHALTTITGSNFEAVDATVLMVNPDSGQAAQTTVAVKVSPASASVQANATQQFTAVITGNSNPAVTWDVNGSPGGNGTVGFIDSINGLYTAPPTAPTPATVIVHATSNAVSSAVGSASVTIVNPLPISVSVSPTSASLRTGRTMQFTATVTNTANTSVSWSVNGIPGGSSSVGTVNSSGLYKTPSKGPLPLVVTVTATSAADPTKSAHAIVTVTRK